MKKENRNKAPRVLPPDPDDMNEKRAAWAGECINLMSTLTGCEPGQEALGDLMCDLFHWGDRNGITPDQMEFMFANRRKAYDEETMADPFPEDAA